MKVVKAVPVSCYGVNHADFSRDGRYFIVSCEFSGEILKVDTARMKVVGQEKLPLRGAMPQDVKISLDGKLFYHRGHDGPRRADPGRREVHPPPPAAHRQGRPRPLHQPRLPRDVHISNRGEGSVSVFDFPQNRLTKKWPARRRQPRHGRGSPPTARSCGCPAATTPRCTPSTPAPAPKLARIKVGSGPHGLAVYPQPGRYSLGAHRHLPLKQQLPRRPRGSRPPGTPVRCGRSPARPWAHQRLGDQVPGGRYQQPPEPLRRACSSTSTDTSSRPATPRPMTSTPPSAA